MPTHPHPTREDEAAGYEAERRFFRCLSACVQDGMVRSVAFPAAVVGIDGALVALHGHEHDDAAISRLRGDLCEAERRGRYVAAFPDAYVVTLAGVVYLVEFKRQRRLTRGRYPNVYVPFEGHGLDAVQGDRYARFYAVTGIPTYFVVYEYDAEAFFAAWLPLLEVSATFTTSGKKKEPRRVFPIFNFERIG